MGSGHSGSSTLSAPGKTFMDGSPGKRSVGVTVTVQGEERRRRVIDGSGKTFGSVLSVARKGHELVVLPDCRHRRRDRTVKVR